MKELLLAAVIAYPVVLFFWKMRNVPRGRDAADFYVASRSVPSEAFIDTSVAYGYQVAAISLFATWGYSYGLWTIWVPAFWALGFFLLRHLVNQGRLDSFFAERSAITLHGLLGKAFKSRFLTRAAALLSILGLSGTAFFEAEFTGSMLEAAVGAPGVGTLAFVGFVGLTVIYILIGGFRAVVETDRIQLSFGFVAFSIVSAMAFAKVCEQGFVHTGIFLSGCGLLLAAGLCALFSRLHTLNADAFPSRWSVALVATLVAQAVGLCWCLFIARSVAAQDTWALAMAEQGLGNVFSLGKLSLLALLVANGLWQLVDVSTWQRLGSLDSQSAAKEELSRSLTFSGFYSAITWTMAILFGMSLKHVGAGVTDAWTAMAQLVTNLYASSATVDAVFVLVLIFAMISIMFSTLDSLISALSFTTQFDLVGGGGQDAPLVRARIATVVFVLVALVAYRIVRTQVSAVDDILYTFYAFQLALFPAVVGALGIGRRNRAAAILGTLLGAVLCVVPLTGYFPSLNPYNSASLFAVGGGTVFYLLGQRLGRFDVA